MPKNVAVVLSGCGFLDGSEIHEAVLLLMHLQRLGCTTLCAAPAGVAVQVVDHRRREPTGERRDALTEAARIARGRISDLATVRAADVDAVALPGGFGAAKNLSDFAAKGAAASVHPEVARLLREAHAARKPIAAICIAPAIVAAVLGRTAHPRLTIGDDEGTAAALVAMGARHVPAKVTECVVDREQRIVTTPAYMFEASVDEVASGIGALAEAFVGMMAEAR